jgi:hypothetical protein
VENFKLCPKPLRAAATAPCKHAHVFCILKQRFSQSLVPEIVCANTDNLRTPYACLQQQRIHKLGFEGHNNPCNVRMY